MRFTFLSEWLAWQEHLHPTRIDPGLERMRDVIGGLGMPPPPFAVVTVGGTNGKGSCVAMLEAILGAAGYRVGAYTSPHLLRYNERIRVCGKEASDALLCGAFDRIDRLRGETTLSYFEFGTLAALDIFSRAGIDIAVLEVGLGGRLDAVNALDCDAALVSTVGVDHVEWLGDERESIGWEKAGIFRTACPAVCGDPFPPHRLVMHAAVLGAPLWCAGRDYGYTDEGGTWSWWSLGRKYDNLPYPALGGPFQLQNASAVLMVLESMKERFSVGREAIARGLETVALPGRFQVVGGAAPCFLDVAHNPHGAHALAGAMRDQPCAGRTHAVAAMLADKDIPGVMAEMVDVVDVWYAADLGGERGASARRIAGVLRALGVRGAIQVTADVVSAYREATLRVHAGDRIVVFGSFRTVAALLQDGVLTRNPRSRTAHLTGT